MTVKGEEEADRRATLRSRARPRKGRWAPMPQWEGHVWSLWQMRWLLAAAIERGLLGRGRAAYGWDMG